MSIRILNQLSATALAAVLAVTLAGCANPVEQIVKDTVGKVVKDQTGVDVNVDTEGSGASLPDGFPNIPTPEGKIVSSVKANKGFMVNFLTDQAAADSIVDQIKGAGFSEESAMDMGEVKIWGLKNAEWNLALTIGADSENSDMRVVSYILTPLEG